MAREMFLTGMDGRLRGDKIYSWERRVFFDWTFSLTGRDGQHNYWSNCLNGTGRGENDAPSSQDVVQRICADGYKAG